jgi:AcrR family transcriptional regulator
MAFGEPIRDRRSERHAATRAEILDAAWALVREQGLAALSLRDVAKAVGMQPPSLYSYFASKSAIYDAMFAQGYRQLLDLFSTVPPASDDEGFKAGARTWFDFCTADPARYQLLFQRTIPGFEPSAESMALAGECLELGLSALTGIGVTADGAIDLYTALLTGLTDQQLSNDPGGDRWARLVDDALDMFLAHVRAPDTTTTTKKKKKGRRP